jgi:hypothetical protein
MRTVFYGVLCPLVASVGVLGNILCLLVLSSPQFNDFLYTFLKVQPHDVDFRNTLGQILDSGCFSIKTHPALNS